MSERTTYPDGIYPDMPLDHYYADPARADWGSLNASNIPTLRNRSPLHFAVRSPVIAARLGLEMAEDAPNAEMRRGNAMHRIALGKGKEYSVGDFKDFRTNEAKAWKAECAANGTCAILQKDIADIERQAERLREHLKEMFFGEEYLTEVAVLWTEHTAFGDVACRALLDAYCPSLHHGVDLKSTADASDQKVIRRMEQNACDIQAAWYSRGITIAEGLTPNKVQFSTLFGETKIPYGSQPFQLSEGWRESAWEECQIALRIFAQCQEQGRWPGYQRNPKLLAPPPWLVSRRMERQLEGIDLDDEPFDEEEEQ
jgi:hypothetical protein